MIAPLLAAERCEARHLARRAIGMVFTAQLGRRPRRSEPLYSLDPITRFALVCEVERQLGITFTDADIEFVETETDLIERGVVALMRRGL